MSDAMQQYESVAAFYHREGKTREALAALKQIVELDPETVANRIKLAELYSKESMPREAIDEFSKAAEQLRQAGRVDDFMKVAERLLFHSPDNRPVTKELAGLYIEKGDPRRALPKLQVCFKADPRDTDVLSLLAQGVRGARSALEVGERAQGAGAHPRRERRRARARRDVAEDLAAGAGRSRRGGGAVESGARAAAVAAVDRRGAQLAAAGARGTVGAVPIARRPDNSTGGRPVAMSASGRMRTVDDVDGGRDWEKPAPQPTTTPMRSGRADARLPVGATPTTRRPTARRRRRCRRGDRQDPQRDRRLHQIQPAREGDRAPAARLRAQSAPRRCAREAEGALPHPRQEGRGGARALVARGERRAGAQAALPARDPRDRSAQRARGRPSSARSWRRRRTRRRPASTSSTRCRNARRPIPRARARRCSTSRISRSCRTTSSTWPSRRCIARSRHLADDATSRRRSTVDRRRRVPIATPAERGRRADPGGRRAVARARVRRRRRRRQRRGRGSLRLRRRAGGGRLEDRFGGFDDSGARRREAHAIDSARRRRQSTRGCRQAVRARVGAQASSGCGRRRRPTTTPTCTRASTIAPLKFDHAALFGAQRRGRRGGSAAGRRVAGVKGTATMKAPRPLLDDDRRPRRRRRTSRSRARCRRRRRCCSPTSRGRTRRRLARGRSRRGRLLHAAVAVRGGARHPREPAGAPSRRIRW